ncbi:hypothetical protein RhiirA5_440405 [Rhizophagus irregularis]|uniref:Uncharacterized protein n=1 Tax=Rhizophagus irregularis TaxID=588596 RepID=A0A2N0RI02_9GLOM|nr:hypothetical protein RhiirA5_440405 [Rhizophagus irregularis]PKC62930.1 hypothetical protein RhiirA1_464452 [Rhizophagus irregularis]
MIASCVNEIFLTMDTTSAHDSNSDDFNTNESNSDANKSDSDVYFKSNDSDSDDDKVREKNTKPADDDFDKILMEIHKNHDIYFDNSIPQLVMNPIISPVTA